VSWIFNHNEPYHRIYVQSNQSDYEDDKVRFYIYLFLFESILIIEYSY
jgi:hypothetical protein